MHADHFAADPAQRVPFRTRAEAAAVDHAFVRHRCEVVRRLRAVPVQLHVRHRFQRLAQGSQQCAVVELAFLRQEQALSETAAERRLQQCDGGSVDALHRGQFGHVLTGAFEHARQPQRFGCVLAVPQHQRAFALEEHRCVEGCQQFRPTPQGMVAHAHHRHRRHGGFGQGCQHRRGHTRGRAIGFGSRGIEQRDLAAGACQRQRHQAAHQAGTEHVGHVERQGLHRVDAMAQCANRP